MLRQTNALLLLLLLTSASIFEFAEGSKKKDREDAKEVTKPGKPKKGASGDSAQQGKSKGDRFAECLNKANLNVQVKRRAGESPGKARAKKEKLLQASSTCADPVADTCSTDSGSGSGNDTNGNSTSGNSNSGSRRLQELLAIDVRSLSVDASRQHLRDLLEAANDDDMVTAGLDTNDEDDVELSERVGSSISKQNLEVFCQTQEEPMMVAIIQQYTDPTASQDTQAKAASALMTGGVYMTFNEKLARLKQAQAAASMQSARVVSQSVDDDCRTGTNTSAIKASTGSKVKCSTNKLASAITPAYMEDKDNGGFVSAVRPLYNPGADGKAIVTKPSTAGNGNNFSEYSSADKWGELFLTAAVFESGIKATQQVLEATTTACETVGDVTKFWWGFGAGSEISPSGPVCRPIGLAIKMVLLVLQLALVDGPRYALTAAGTQDLVIQAVEVESIAENTISVIHNQKVTFNEVGNTAAATQSRVTQTASITQDLVSNTAGETQELVVDLISKVEALEKKILTLIERRSCDIQNSVANVHNTANHVQNLLLVPEGTRPGFAQRPVSPLQGCAIQQPAICIQASRNTTPAVNPVTQCNPLVNGTSISTNSAALVATPLSADATSIRAASVAELPEVVTPLGHQKQAAAAQGQPRRMNP